MRGPGRGQLRENKDNPDQTKARGNAVGACGIGLTRSIRSRGTSDITLSVPSMNIRAMSGAATSTERVMLRLALRVSSAIIAPQHDG